MHKRVISFGVLVVALAVAAGAASTQSKNDQSSTQSGQTSSTQTSSAQSSGNQQSMEGCLVREQHAIYLMPATGEKVQVSSSGDQDLSSHMGQEVRLTGSSSQGSSQSSTSSTSGTSSSSAGSEPQFVVTRVDEVAQTCPQDIQNRIDKDKTSSNNPK